MTQVAEEVLM